MRKFTAHARILHGRPNRLFFLAVLAAALALGAAAALADTIDCPGGGCAGTNDNDTLRGTDGFDLIAGYGGADTITGGGGNDELYGDNQLDLALDGADSISGGGGSDLLYGYGGADLLIGGRGNDIIEAREFANHPPGEDTVKGGRGNDTINANDGVKDTIDCGPGNDGVVFDQALDTLTNCEDKVPR